MHIAVFGRDIEVTDQHQRRVSNQFVGDPALQGLQPAELVLELVAVDRLAVGHIGADHPNPVDRGRDDPGLLVGVTGDVLHHVSGGQSSQQGDAVVGLLPEPLRRVARRHELGMRKLVVGELGFL